MSADLRRLDEVSPEAREMLDTLDDALGDAEELTRRLAEAVDARQADIAGLRAVLDAVAAGLDDAFVVVDRRLAVRVATQAARRLLGLDTAPAHPTLDDVLPGDVVRKLRHALGFALACRDDGNGPVTARTGDLQLSAHRATSEAHKAAPRGPVRWQLTAPENVAAYAVVHVTEVR